MAVLTRAEAVARRAIIDVTEYLVDLDLRGAEVDDEAPDHDRTHLTFGSRSTIRFSARPGSETFVEATASDITSATLNGFPLDVATRPGGRLVLPGLAGENELVVTGRFAYSRSGEGLHRYRDAQDGLVYLYSQTFLSEAQRVFACFDQPDLKAPFTFTVTAPVGWTVLTNTAGREVAPGRWEFERSAPLATYVTALAAGPYAEVRDRHDGIDLGLYCRRSLRPFLHPERMLTTTRAGLDHFHDLLGIRYPFGKYDQVMVPELNPGAMENPGLITFRDDQFLPRGTTTRADHEALAGTQLHEMAHMWFGDLVTMRWWDDLWLNESFAEYLAHQALVATTEHTDAWTTFSWKRKTWGYHADQRSTTHPIASDASDTMEALGNFDGISYAKGASALRQLASWLGEEVFIDGLKAYLGAHLFDNATLRDLVDAMSETSGRDVGAWADLWLRTAGVNTLSVDLTVADGRHVEAVVRQTAPGLHPTLRPHTIRIGLYDLDVDRLIPRPAVDVDVLSTPTTPVPDLIGQQSADLVLPNKDDLTFALTVLDDRSLATALDRLHQIEDASARALVWTALWQMVRSGTLTPERYLQVVRTSVVSDDGPTAAATVLGQAVTAATLWCTSTRSQQAETLARWCSDLAREADPGGDLQLELVRAWCRVTSDVTTVDRWSRGNDLPPGLRFDTDLRWRLLTRLAATGALDAPRLDVEYEQDRSSVTWLHRLHASAALPTSEAKELAWTRATDGSLSNHEMDAVGRGFWQWGQDDLLQVYRVRYAEDLAGRMGSSSASMLKVFGQMFFPRTLVDQVTVETADRLIGTPGLPPAARRTVAECRDDVLDGLRAMHLG